MTQAQTVAAIFGDDGQCWHIDEGEDGVDIIQTSIDEMCERHGARREWRYGHGTDTYRWVWADGSVLTMAGAAWDFGYQDCWCWDGTGHTEECEVA